MISRRSLLAYISAAASTVAAPFAARASVTEDDMARLAKEQLAMFANLPPIERFERIVTALTVTAAEFDDSPSWQVGYAISPNTLEGISGDVNLIPRPTRPHLMLIDQPTGNIVVVGLPEGFASWERVLDAVKAAARG